MTDLPEELGQWNYETILELVRTRQFEPEQFDYKEVLHAERGDRPAWNLKIAKAACSMANANGGFLIFGVVDRALQVANIDDRIVGIPLVLNHAGGDR